MSRSSNQYNSQKAAALHDKPNIQFDIFLKCIVELKYMNCNDVNIKNYHIDQTRLLGDVFYNCKQ